MPPKSLSLKKGQQGPPKNQKAITHFFKNTNVTNTPNVLTHKSSPISNVSVKRKATSPLRIETPETPTTCTSNKIDINKKLKSDNQNCTLKSPLKNCVLNGTTKSPIKNSYHSPAKKSPGKENGFKSKAKSDSDFDSLLRNDHVEINENPTTPPKKKSPLTPSQENNIIDAEIQSILDDDEIECKSGETTSHMPKQHCEARFSPNLYDIQDESSPEVNSMPKSGSSAKLDKSPLKINKSPDKCAKVLEFDDPEVDSMFGEDWAEDAGEDTIEDLDLSKIQRCEIETINSMPNRLELKLKNATNNRATCFVEGIWLHTPLQPGDIISILAPRDPSGQFTVGNSAGLLVLRPDRLVSATSVVAGVFCPRKAVLQERWRGIDSANTAMTIGILVHELVQTALTQNIRSVQQLRIEADKIIKQSIQSLYDAGLSEEEACSNMQQYITPLAEFMRLYMSDKPPPNMDQKDKWCGNINKVLDIEENLCSPQLGLKGKIDATLQVTIHERKGRQTAVVPLELKSGRASVSAEHRGQLVLYGMMLALQRAVDPALSDQRGLLLYLKERVDLREVSCGYPERRDLMMLRNQLVQYLADGPTATDPEQMTDIEEASSLLQQGLPEPVNHHNACAKCPYLTVCSLHLWHTNGPTVSENHPLSRLKSDALGHLSAEHIKYFLHWTALLKMEETGQISASPLHALWTDNVEKRSKRGTCAANLRLKSAVQSGDRYTHTFERQSINNGDKTQHHKTKGPQEGDFSIVSIDSRPWIAAGVVTVSKENEMQILLERDLSRRLSKDTMYHIDTYESYATTVQNLTNLGVLLEDSDRALRLRKIIIDKETPEFEKKLPREVGRLGTKMMKSLNIQQQRAVLKALAARDYALLQGLPGTGKTQTISVLIQMLVALKQRVLVTAHTHSAVDTVLSRLPESVRVLRLGAAARAAPGLRARCEQQLAANCDTPLQLEQLYKSMEVVGVTCLGAAHAMLARTTFDVCIVDEATQVLQCTVLRPLFAANRFVLVGDPEQLPPVVRSRAARRLGMEESLFHRLMTEEATSTLQLQYRMNQALADLANKVAYNDRLKCADEKVAQAKLNINAQKLSAHTSEAWLLRACSAAPENAVLFFDLKMLEKTEVSKTCANPDEACLVVAIVEALIAGDVKPTDIGVISPFREQVALLRRALSVEVSTVDQFQGRDKSVIVYSCTKRDVGDNKVKEGEVLNDQRRLAVGVTRAKHKLLIIGNSKALQRYAPLRRLIDVCPSLIMERETINQVIEKYKNKIL